MDYSGPQTADYDNVRALNLAFLKLLAQRERAGRLMRHLPPALLERGTSLTVLERERLAATPFLLFSCRESDADYWGWLFDSGSPRDLLDETPVYDAVEAGMVSAALGFMWQLARLNPYAARLICGASLHWCEQLAERPLLDVVSAATTGSVLKLRFATDAHLWNKLLHAATSGVGPVANAARISALQRVLTRVTPNRMPMPALAASRLLSPTFKVADEIER